MRTSRLSRVLCLGVLLVPALAAVLANASLASDAVSGSSHSSRPESSLANAPWRLGPEIQISTTTATESHSTNPSTTYDSRNDEFMIVWEKATTSQPDFIEARSITTAGDLNASSVVFAGAYDSWEPAVVYNATDDEFLVVWSYGTGDCTPERREIWGSVVDRKGHTVTDATRIAGDATVSFRLPRVAWNSEMNEYIVVWHAEDTVTGEPRWTAYAVLSAKLSELAGDKLFSGDSPSEADVAYNPSVGEYFVTWGVQYSGGGSDPYLRAYLHRCSAVDAVDPRLGVRRNGQVAGLGDIEARPVGSDGTLCPAFGVGRNLLHKGAGL